MHINDIYETDIELVMDFMKLSIIYDSTNIKNCKRIIKLQKRIIDNLPVAQSERMSSVYTLLQKIYHENKKEYINNNKKIKLILYKI